MDATEPRIFFRVPLTHDYATDLLEACQAFRDSARKRIATWEEDGRVEVRKLLDEDDTPARLMVPAEVPASELIDAEPVQRDVYESKRTVVIDWSMFNKESLVPDDAPGSWNFKSEMTAARVFFNAAMLTAPESAVRGVFNRYVRRLHPLATLVVLQQLEDGLKLYRDGTHRPVRDVLPFLEIGDLEVFLSDGSRGIRQEAITLLPRLQRRLEDGVTRSR